MQRSSVKIGALVPLSRPGWVEAGRHLLAGLSLAARELEIDGRPIELTVRDSTDPTAVDELAGLGAAALAGEYHSVTARATAARADALGLPFLCSSAVLDALTDQPTDRVARLAPAQSHGWSVYAGFLRDAGHRRIAVAAQPSVYWEAGTRILRNHLDVVEVDPAAVCEELVDSGATALLVLTGYPEPAASIVGAVRGDPRLAEVLIGAPAGQPEFADWAGVPFLRYLPSRLGPLGTRVSAALGSPSFVAFEGYDTVLVLAEMLRSPGASWADVSWAGVDVEGTRGRIRFSRVPGISVWQWAWPPVQVVDRDPADPSRFRILRT